MPNHYLTVGLCARDWPALEAKGLEDFDFSPLKGANLCEILQPLPVELEGVVSMMPPSRCRHKVTGEWSKDCNSPISGRNEYERVPLTKEEQSELMGKFGAVTWYEWQSQNWGTKWGTYNLVVHELNGDGSPVLVEFQTAWRPPNPQMMRKISDYLCEVYYLKSITWIGHDPACDETEPIDIQEVAA